MPGDLQTKPLNAKAECNLCESSISNVVSTVDRRNQYLKTVICKECGLVYTQDIPITDLKHYYTEAYRGDIKQPPLKHVMRHGQNALSRFAVLKNYLKPNHTIFDIGSGNGEFVYLLSYLGYGSKGIEPHRNLAEYSKRSLGVDIEVNFLEDYAAGTNEQFDIVTIFHVLEHKENPSETMAIIHSLLKPDGLCVVEVPNISSYCVAPKNLFHVDHLFNFNEATLTLLGKKAGFIPLEVICSPHYPNITIVFQKTNFSKPLSYKSVKNYQHLHKKLKAHTNLKHYFTLMPYKRFFKKGMQYLYEKRYTAEFVDSKQLLDALFKINV